MKRSLFISHVIAMIEVTIIIGLIFVVVQQSYRTGADDPQAQLAEDISSRLEKGRSIEKLFPADSLYSPAEQGVFCVLFDSKRQPIRSSLAFDNKEFSIPAGVFDFTNDNGENRITREIKGIRLAMVIVKTNASPVAYVAVGRSLRQVQERVTNLSTTVLIAWLLCLAAISINGAIQFSLQRKRPK